jgi:hypothetical protein
MKVVESTKLGDATAADEADLPAVPGLSRPRIAGFTLAMSCSERLADPARLRRDHSDLVRWRTCLPMHPVNKSDIPDKVFRLALERGLRCPIGSFY